MIDRLTCLAQIGLSVLVIGGYVTLYIAAALGHIQWPSETKFDELVLLVAFFWFQRQRSTTETKAP